MLEGVLSMQNLISDPVSMTSCRQEAYLLRLRRQFPFVYVKTLTRTVSRIKLVVCIRSSTSSLIM